MQLVDYEGNFLAKITIQLTDEQHARFVNAKMRRKTRSLQALMIDATEQFLDEGKRATGDTSVKSDPVVLDSDKVLTVESEALQISSGELSWVQKLVRILRSRRRSLITALQHNLTAFSGAADDADQLDTLKSAEVPTTGAGLTGSAEGDIEGTAGDRGFGASDDPTDQELIDRARAITERQAERRRRAKGTPRKTG